MSTCPTPSIWDSFWEIFESAISKSLLRGTVLDVRSTSSIGASVGLVLRYRGRLGIPAGSCPAAALIAAWTSRAAASMFRSRSNCRVIFVAPSWLVEVISVTPAIRPKDRSSGVATDDAIVSGLAPGNVAWMFMVGNSTRGKAATGRKKYAIPPASRTAIVRRDVATGRPMKTLEMCIDGALGLTANRLATDNSGLRCHAIRVDLVGSLKVVHHSVRGRTWSLRRLRRGLRAQKLFCPPNSKHRYSNRHGKLNCDEPVQHFSHLGLPLEMHCGPDSSIAPARNCEEFQCGLT